MKKSTIIVIVVIVLIAIWGITSYNGMVKMDDLIIYYPNKVLQD